MNAFEYYEQKLKGLGEKFLNELKKRFNDLEKHPQHYSFIDEDKTKVFRDVLLKSFPFVIVFEINKTEVIVYAVHNVSLNPKKKLRKI